MKERKKSEISEGRFSRGASLVKLQPNRLLIKQRSEEVWSPGASLEIFLSSPPHSTPAPCLLLSSLLPSLVGPRSVEIPCFCLLPQRGDARFGRLCIREDRICVVVNFLFFFYCSMVLLVFLVMLEVVVDIGILLVTIT